MSAMREPRVRFAPEEYLLLERNADYRSEYLDGYLYVMSGASPTHEAIVANLNWALLDAIGDGPCRVFSSNLRLKSPSDRFYGYPDVTVVCDDLLFHDDSRDVIVNPKAVFEILSPSTEAYDRGEKFERYREIESLVECVLISQEEAIVETRFRAGDRWESKIVSGMDASLPLVSLSHSIQLGDLYRRISFAEE